MDARERDLLIRTVIGEADDEPDEGKAGVAYSVLNRKNAGGYGDTIPKILFAPKQYEPWNTRAKQLMSYAEEHPSYIKAAKVVDGVLSGEIADPTNGATHFANRDIVEKRGNRSALKWIDGMQDVGIIGSHTFGKADAGRTKVASNEDFSDLISKFGGTPEKATGEKEDFTDLISKFSKPVAKEAAVVEPAKVAPAVVAPPISGVDQATSDKRNAEMAAQPVEKPRTWAQSAGDVAMAIPTALNKGIDNTMEATAEHFGSAKKMVGEGVSAIAANRSAEGVGKIGMGALGMAASPLTGATEAMIEKPATQLTGNKQFGETLGLVATSGVPLGKLARATSEAMPSNKALNAIVDAVGVENLLAVVQRLKDNPRLSIYDVSPEVQQMAQKLVVTEGSHQGQLVRHADSRAAGAKGAVEGAYDTAMGAPVNVLEKVETMKQAARETGAKLINPVVESSKPAEITGVIKHIEDEISKGGHVERQTLKQLKAGEPVTGPTTSEAQQRMFQIREQLRGDWKDRDEMFLDVKGEQGAHRIQSELRAEAQSLLDSDRPQDRMLGKRIMDVRNKLVDAIDEGSKSAISAEDFLAKHGYSKSTIANFKDVKADAKLLGWKEGMKGEGAYKKGLSAYADDMQVQEAFQAGTQVFRNRPTVLEDRPEYLARLIKGDPAKNIPGAPKEIVDAYREGARVSVDNQIRAMKNAATKGEMIAEIDFNRQKMELLFGKDEVKKMRDTLHDERDIAVATQKLLHGSQTAMRLKADSRVDVREPTKGSLGLLPAAIMEGASTLATGTPGLGAAAYGVMRGAGYAKDKIGIASDVRRNQHITNILTAEGAQRDEVIKALEAIASNPRRALVKRGGSSLARAIAP